MLHSDDHIIYNHFDFIQPENFLQVVMRRAQSMAQAAWTRPTLGLSSWSCMGPRHRPAAAAHANSKEEGDIPESSSSKTETSGPLLMSPKKTRVSSSIEAIELPVSSSIGVEWTSEIESCSTEVHNHMEGIVDLDDGGEDLMGHNSHEDRMNEVELWQQLEQELYDTTKGEEDDVAKEIREEEAAAIAEVGEAPQESSAQEMKEAHRFFPPGKIMHIVTLPSETEGQGESDDPSTTGTSDTSDDGQEPAEDKVGIFLTPRSLYSKLRLCQTMVSDHFMPVYRRQIEKVIRDLENKEEISKENYLSKRTEAVVL